jgi:multimeric flavodoxin WrbA
MTDLYGKLITAERIALAAPVFFYSLPAQAKAIVDRCQALWARKYILKQLFPPAIHPRRGFFMSLGGSNGENLFTGIGQTVKYFFDAIGVDYTGNLFFRQIDSKNDIAQHPTALKEAFAAGRKFIIGP